VLDLQTKLKNLKYNMTSTILERAITSIQNILSIKELPNIGIVPQPLVALAKSRGGMSALRATNRVLEKKKELGLPTGNLADGSANFDDILWYTAIKSILDEITNEAKISSVAIPGTQIVAAGGNAGGPITVYGSTTTFADGASIIE
jgi:hypothetical protein